ncbi:MAG TPA: DUF742 domain-containing protein [Actinomycetota bacterium]
MSSDDPHGHGRARHGPVVRPYAITGGRARPRHRDLEVEALVSTAWRGEPAPHLSYERRSIIRLCQEVQSVAEIAARMEVPLGVARVLVADMAEERLVSVHRPRELVGDRPDPGLLERVLYGLRNL